MSLAHGIRVESERDGRKDLAIFETERRGTFSLQRLAPPLALLVVLTALGVVINWARLGLDLAGGRLLPVGDLGELWSTYLANWHPVGGGTTAAAPTALAVLGVIGAVFTPIGGPAAFVAILLLGDIPLAALSAYGATRRLPVHRWVRAALAAAYGLLPAATAGVAQGRLDVVVAHLLLPLVLLSIARLLFSAGGRWLHSSVVCAVALALLGAFSPLGHLMALFGLFIGFIALPVSCGLMRRVAAVVTVTLLPIALLLPWSTELVKHPALVLHGLGTASDSGPVASGGELVGLDPGGAGALPFGIAVVAAALIAVALRPTMRVIAGLGVALTGLVGVLVLGLVPVEPLTGGPASHGYPGVPLLVIGAGLLLVVLAVCQREQGRHARPAAWLPRFGAITGVILLIALAVGALIGGRGGPLRSGGRAELASPASDELADSGRSVLVIGENGLPARQAGGRLPRFGDDDLPSVTGTPERLANWQRDLLSGAPRQTVTTAAASGVRFIVLPTGMKAADVVRAADGLAEAAQPTEDGRQVLRLLPASGQAMLISPEEARRAIGGQPPGGAPVGASGVSPVQADLPDVRVRVSDGPAGRLLVLAAEEEPGWRAFIDGKRVPIVRAWGHQVAVEVPTNQARVILDHPAPVQGVLYLVQVAGLLFAILTAIPGRLRDSTEVITRHQ